MNAVFCQTIGGVKRHGPGGFCYSSDYKFIIIHLPRIGVRALALQNTQIDPHWTLAGGCRFHAAPTLTPTIDLPDEYHGRLVCGELTELSMILS